MCFPLKREYVMVPVGKSRDVIAPESQPFLSDSIFKASRTCPSEAFISDNVDGPKFVILMTTYP